MKQHKLESLIKFIHLDGVKEFKETNPSLFSKDGISTSTLDVEGGKTAVVTMADAKNACEMFIDGQLTLHQLQQWGEWIHMMDFFELNPDGEAPDYDETLINVISDIDMLDFSDTKLVIENVNKIIKTIDKWLRKTKN